MPWTGSEFASRHNHSLSGPAAGKAASIANAILKRTGDEGLAIRTANARAAGHASGGVAGRDMGGGINPVQAMITALQQGAGPGAGAMGQPAMPVPNAGNPAQPSSIPATNATSPTGIAPASSSPATGVMARPSPLPVQPVSGKARGGVPGLAIGGFDIAKGSGNRPPFYARQAERMMHTGAVRSNVPGRTDNHQVKVPGGSYVLPAAHIASMGHGNSNAGLDLAEKMFGGPPPPHFSKPNLPRPPKPMTQYAIGGIASEGGARETHEQHDPFHPVDVDISGGEYVIPPWAIIKRWGTLKHGHQFLDNWVMSLRKKEIKTQRNLPPPAKKWTGGAVGMST